MPDQHPLGSDQQRSLWMETGAKAPALPSLEGSVEADVAIVGGGFTGLVCALRLAEHGTRVALLEAEAVGNGGSGRNGGQVIPGLKHDPRELTAQFGQEAGERMIALAGSAAERVFRLIAKYGIACNAEQNGWIQPAHAASALATLHARAEDWARRGAPVEILDRGQTAERLGTDFYHGAWIDRRAGVVQPLSYARGLAAAAVSAGAAIFQYSPALRIDRAGGRWTIAAPRGELRAAQAVLATDAYSGELWPELRRGLVALNSVIVATDPLPEAVRARVLPCRLPVSETRKLVYYYRLDTNGRFLMGGRGNVEGIVPDHVFAMLRRVAERLFPALKGMRWPYRWWGQVGFTMDWLPHLVELSHDLWTSVGYCGRGVAMATAMGEVLANRLLGGQLAAAGDPALDFPVTPLARVPLWSFRKLGVASAIGYFRVREALGVPA